MRLHNRYGFSAVEALVAISILSLAGFTLVSMVTQSLNVYSRGESGTNAVDSATIAIQRLTNDIRDGRRATYSDGTLTVYYPRTVTDPNTHESMYDLSAENPIPHSYYLSEGNLVREVNGTETIMARGITKIGPDGQEYEPFGASGGTINVTLTGIAQTGSKESKQQVFGRISLRNFRY